MGVLTSKIKGTFINRETTTAEKRNREYLTMRTSGLKDWTCLFSRTNEAAFCKMFLNCFVYLETKRTPDLAAACRQDMSKGGKGAIL